MFYSALAYGSWGLVAFYFKAVAAADLFEVLCHRVIWSVLLLTVMIHFRGQWGEARELIRDPGTWRLLGPSTVLIAINWTLFIYAVVTDRLVDASLGYFINPLVSIVLGMVFLGERLRPRQWVAVALAALGVVVYTWTVGSLPWISLVLAFSFGLYGLVRKQARAGPIIGLAFETALLAPAGVVYLIVMNATGVRPVAFLDRTGAGSPALDLLLVAAGVVTTFPLLWFAGAARRLRLSTIGFMQYTSPTLQFLIAVFVFGEPFDSARAVSFAVIWAGVAVFLTDSLHNRYVTRERATRAVFTD
ncbi:MAG: EamA family transporter RarD [Phycisphaerales bacterium]|nr:EamA family transporter RarD [Phycisphaerales bacterium]